MENDFTRKYREKLANAKEKHGVHHALKKMGKSSHGRALSMGEAMSYGLRGKKHFS